MNQNVEQQEGELLDSMPVQTQNQSPAANPYMAMASRALDLGKVDEMSKLLDLQLKWEAEQQMKTFVAAMADVKLEPMVIEKGKHVKFNTSKGVTEYDHSELHHVTSVLIPAMARYGITHSWTFRQDAKGITVGCVLSHRAGHRQEPVEMTAPPDDSGGKNTIQSIASTKTYLERYTLLAAMGMATGGTVDDDGRSAYAEPEIHAKDQAWIDAVSALTDYPEYMDMKKKMLADYGGRLANIPVAVRDTFNRIAAMTKPKD